MINLKKLLKDAKLTQIDIENALDIKSLRITKLKINGYKDFTTREANILKNLINNKMNSNYSLEELFFQEKS